MVKGPVVNAEWAYHWAPRSRRKPIERLGLVPGRLSRDGLWRPPFVCLSFDPVMAWGLAHVGRGAGETWDLWGVQINRWDYEIGHEKIFEQYMCDEPKHYVKEIRVYERIHKRYVTWIAERIS